MKTCPECGMRIPRDCRCDSSKGEPPVAGSATGSASAQLEWLWANCKIVYWDKHDLIRYPIEHNPHAQKYSRDLIEAEMPNSSSTK